MEEIEERKNRNKEKGWIYLGELEYSDAKFTPTSDSIFPFYLYCRYDTNNKMYYYAISNDIATIGSLEHFGFKEPIGIIPFLKMYVSMDINHGGGLIQKMEGFKIKLIGMPDWIEVDEDFKKYRITLSELKLKCESNKLEKLKEKSGNNNLKLNW